MKRMQFLSFVLFAGTAVVAAPRAFTLYNVTPLSVGHEATAAADAVELQARTGADLALYSLTLHPEGVPAIEKAERYVESFRAFKRAGRHAGARRRAGAGDPRALAARGQGQGTLDDDR